MSITDEFSARLARARGDAVKVADDVLLSRDLAPIASRIAEQYQFERVRLGRVILDNPHPTRIGAPGGPGDEDSIIVSMGTAVELWVQLSGAATMVAAMEPGDRLSKVGVSLDTERGFFIARYVAEQPLAEEANRFFEAALRAIETEVTTVNGLVDAFNDELEPRMQAELEGCRDHAKGRVKFAEDLVVPPSYDRRWGMP